MKENNEKIKELKKEVERLKEKNRLLLGYKDFAKLYLKKIKQKDSLRLRIEERIEELTKDKIEHIGFIELKKIDSVAEFKETLGKHLGCEICKEIDIRIKELKSLLESEKEVKQ